MSDSSLENRLVDVFTQIAKDIKSHSGGSSSSSLEFSELKKLLNSKGYYCKDATLQSLLECLVSGLSDKVINVTYEKSVGKVVFTSLPHVVFTIDDVRYEIGESGTFELVVKRPLKLKSMDMWIL